MIFVSEKYKFSSNALFDFVAAARMMYLLDESKQEEAVKLTTSLEPHITDVDLQVSIIWIVSGSRNFSSDRYVSPGLQMMMVE